MTNDLATRIAEYLSGGGLFNPELADHNQVSLLIRDARDEIDRLTASLDATKAQLEKAREALEPFAKAADELIPGTPDTAGVMWDGIVAMANAGHLRTAARVHAETKSQSQS